jgi:hypothetical protein
MSSEDTKVNQYAEVTTTNDYIILQQVFEVQCNEKLMIYYMTWPGLNTSNILEVIVPKIQPPVPTLPSLTLRSSSVWIYHVESIRRQRINEFRR